MSRSSLVGAHMESENGVWLPAKRQPIGLVGVQVAHVRGLVSGCMVSPSDAQPSEADEESRTQSA